jgi:hypothetical protein
MNNDITGHTFTESDLVHARDAVRREWGWLRDWREIERATRDSGVPVPAVKDALRWQEERFRSAVDRLSRIEPRVVPDGSPPAPRP